MSNLLDSVKVEDVYVGAVVNYMYKKGDSKYFTKGLGVVRHISEDNRFRVESNKDVVFLSIDNILSVS